MAASTGEPGGSWLQYVAGWAGADIAVPSSDLSSTYALGVESGSSVLQVTVFDGSRPCTELDRRRNDLSPYRTGEQARRRSSPAGPPQGGSASASTGASTGLRPIACVASLSPHAESEWLIVLFSTGLLVALDAVHLGVEAVLGSFPDVDDSAIGAPLAVLKELGWAVVAEGARLGFAPLDAPPSEIPGITTGGGGGGAGGGGKAAGRVAELPKGCSATALVANIGGEPLLVVGCGNGRVLLYSATVVQKGQGSRIALTLLQTVDISGLAVSMPAAGFRSKIKGLMGMTNTAAAASAASALGPVGATGGGLAGVVDVAHLGPGAGLTSGLLAVCGGAGAVGGQGNGMLSVWQVSSESWRDGASGGSRQTTAVFRHMACAACNAPVFRIVLIAPGRLSSAYPIAITLDAFADLTLWAVQSSQLTPLFAIPGRHALEVSAARTFALTGSIYLLSARGKQRAAQIGWLDAAALLESASVAGAPLVSPLGGRSRSCLGPPPGMGGQGAAGAAPATVAGGGEVFFVGNSELRCYRAASGKTSQVKIQGLPSGICSDWRALEVMDVLTADSTSPASHLLVGILEVANNMVARAAWLICADGDFVCRMPGAIGGAFLGSSLADMQVVWLTCSLDRDGGMNVNIADAFGGVAVPALQATLSQASPGVERLIGGPPHDKRFLLYWGSRLPGGPLHLDASLPHSKGHSIGPAEAPALLLPLPLAGSAGCPCELVDAQWSHRESQSSPRHLALAAPLVVWVASFSEASASSPPIVQLLAWIDLRVSMLGAGRALSVAWLVDNARQQALLVSTPSGVAWWPVQSSKPPRALILCERPQLLVGALLDRLLCVEVHCGKGFFSSGTQEASTQQRGRAGQTLPRGPRARIRERPVSYLEALSARHAVTPAEASALTRESDWHMVPAELGSDVSREVSRNLWPAAACVEVPPQLFSAARSFHRAATAAGDPFRGLAAIVSGLQSSLARSRRGDGSAEESKAIDRVEEHVLHCRTDPSRLDMLRGASALLMDCAALVSGPGSASATGLAIASRGISKHDLLPFGMLLAVVVRGTVQCPGMRVSLEGPGPSAYRSLVVPEGAQQSSRATGRKGETPTIPSPLLHWSAAMSAPAPLAAELLARLGSKLGTSRRGSLDASPASDFSAQALLQQQYLDNPSTRRPPQTVEPSGQAVCQLHTATVMQWLGLASTQLQVRVFQALQHEAAGDHAGTAVTSSGGAAGAKNSGRAATPPTVLGTGVLVYWRCSDGDGGTVRDSAGCGRMGQLVGPMEWLGPLPPDEPLEAADDWGSAVVPNFALALGQGALLQYSPAGGAAGAEDRQQLSLVGGSKADRAAGERLLKKAGAEPAGDDRGFGAIGGGDDRDEEAGAVAPGWTVELWALLTEGAANDLVLFSRTSAGGGPTGAPLTWTYRKSPAGFAVKGGAQTLAAGPVEALPAGQWVHLALRCDLTKLEVWVSHEVALCSTPGTALPAVPADAGLCFGPAKGLEITEIRVWGIWRSDVNLMEQQQRPLTTLMPGEKKADALKKVRIRAASAPATDDFAPGLWSLPDLLAPSGAAPGGGRRRGGSEPAVQTSKTVGHAPRGASQVDFPEDQSVGGARASSAWPDGDDHVVPAVPSGGLPAIEESPASTPQEVPNERDGAALGGISDARVQNPPAASVSSGSRRSSAATDAVVPSWNCISVPQLQQAATETEDDENEDDDDDESSDEDSVDSEPSAQAPAGGKQRSPNKSPAQMATTTVDEVAHARSKRSFGLCEVLPRPWLSEKSGIEATDASLRVAGGALERGSAKFAVAAFRGALAQLARQLSLGSKSTATPALRARFEATSAYITLCALLQDCAELRKVASSGGLVTPALLQKLCLRWACVLRVAKAPRHTVQYAVQAMANFFSCARQVGGWTAARQVASMLLERCRGMLSAEELVQVEYVRQATAHGNVAGGAYSSLDGAGVAAACGGCPCCNRPLDVLSLACRHCGAEIAVCFRDLVLCDARGSAQCTLCGAVAGRSGQAELARQWRPSTQGHATSVRSSTCFLCNIGELRPQGLSLAF